MKKLFALLLSLMILTAASGMTEALAEVQVGISWVADFEDGVPDEDTQAYIDAVTKAGGIPVYLPQVTDEESANAALALVDCLILTGGEDLNPSFYGEEPDEMLEDVNDERDLSDWYLARAAVDNKFPLLATCRGMQLIDVLFGGTLYQDLPTQYENAVEHRSQDLIDFAYHQLTITDADSLVAQAMGGAGTYEVNSWHHQGVKTVGEGLTVTALAEDGMIEALELEDPDFFMLAVQFHPEWHVDDGSDEFLSFFTMLMDAAAAGN